MGKRLNSKNLVVFFLYFLLSVKSFAGIDSDIKSKPGPFTVGDAVTLEDTKYTLAKPTLSWGNITNLSVQNSINLRINDNIRISYNFKYKITVKLEYYTSFGSNPDFTIPSIPLEVEYKVGQGITYKGIDTYTFNGAYSIKVTVLTVDNENTPGPGANMVSLDCTYDIKRQYLFNAGANIALTASIVIAKNNLSNQLQISWVPVDGAEDYDVEWTTLDANDDNEALVKKMIAGTITSYDNPDNIFHNNATRITTSVPQYTLSLLCNNDYLCARIRQVQYTPDGIRLEGDWIYSTKSTTGGYAVWDLSTYWYQSNLNWQYSAAFAEEGKKKEVVSFFDGTLRNRQTVTINNTDKTPVVQENIYDEFGRPIASILPAPVLDVPVLKYFPKFNVAGTNPYNYSNIIGNSISSICESIPNTLDLNSGAAQYYSPNNAFLIAQPTLPTFNYIPDAGGYPLSVSKYTADNTGRIKMQGGVGPAFQPGQGSVSKTTKYYYGKPEQWELDQLFGNDVGYAEHYLKNMVVDPNNQVSISYVNSSGKTIATALAGEKPTSLDAVYPQPTSSVANDPQKAHSLDVHLLKAEQFVLDPSGLKLSATSTYLAPLPGSATITYDIEQLAHVVSANGNSFCSTCYYDLNVLLKDDCNNTIKDTTLQIGLIGEDCKIKLNPLKQLAPLQLGKIGEYYITFEFVLSKTALENYTDDFITKGQASGMLLSQWSFFRTFLDKMDYTGCLSDCKTCIKTLGTKENFIHMMDKEMPALGVRLNAPDLPDYEKFVSDKYDALLLSCQALVANCTTSPCESYETRMKIDVSPNGQYAYVQAQTSTSTDMSHDNEISYLPLEQDVNILFQNWRTEFPVLPATSDIYKGELITKKIYVQSSDPITKSTTVITSPYDAAFTFSDLVKYWKKDWALKFLKYHPEYCKLAFCYLTSNYRNWDETIKQTSNLADILLLPGAPASITNISITDSEWLIDSDPFFKTGSIGASYHDQIKNDLTKYSQNILKSTSSPVIKGLSQTVDYLLYCAPKYDPSNPNADLWSTCAPACRVPEREWSTYLSYYFDLKKAYYDLASQGITCPSSCSVGKPTVAVRSDCPQPSDFSITPTQGADTSVTGMQNLTITAIHGNVANDVTLNLYYPLGISGTMPATSQTLTAGKDRLFISVPSSLPVGSIRVKSAICSSTSSGSGSNSYASSQPSSQGMVTINWGIFGPIPIPQGSDFYISSAVYDPGSLATAFTVKINPNIIRCTRNDMVAHLTVYYGIEQDCEHDVTINGTSNTGTLVVPNFQYFNSVTVSGFVSACTANPSTYDNGCPEGYQYKASRFPTSSRNAPYESDAAAAIGRANSDLQTQIKSTCENNVFIWKKALAPGLASYSDAEIATLMNDLTAVCAAGGDISHPMGASTTPTAGIAPTGGTQNFGDVIIKAINRHNNTSNAQFTPLLNPWLIDGPGPYGLVGPKSDVIVSVTNNDICDVLTTVKAAAGTTDLYQYLRATYKSAMTLSQDELTALQTACTCSNILPHDITLPVFMQKNGRGSVDYSTYTTIKAKLATYFDQSVFSLASSIYYPQILTNYLNQSLGFSLSYTQYKQFEANHITINGYPAILLNNPPFRNVPIDPYSCIKNMMAIGVANGESLYAKYIEEQRDQFKLGYINTCGAAKAKVDINVPQQVYHYTLYYYDQADNLVRTVPPMGVNIITDPAKLQQVQAFRAISTTDNISPTTNSDQVAAFTELSNLLSSAQGGAIEMWFNTTGNFNMVKKTPDSKFIFQVSLTNNGLNVDIYSSANNGVSYTHTNYAAVDMSAIQPLQPWIHVVIQRANFTSLQAGALKISVNGLDLPMSTTAGNPQGTVDDLSALKHMRLYSRFMAPIEILVNAANPTFTPINADAKWYRFNVPAPGSNGTLGDNTTIETNLTGVFPNHTLTTNYAYNSTNQVVQQYSPDGGTNNFWYDMLSRLVGSQNDKQAAATNYSYTQYDKLGRIAEVGQKNSPTVTTLAATNYLADNGIEFLSTGTNSQITHTYYDDAAPVTATNGILSFTEQDNLRKRVSASTYRELGTSPVQQATYYNYDLDGNVKTLWQQINGLDPKRVDYEYDLISGKVNFVSYQNGKTDQFYYKYEYDADNRLTDAWSGTSAIIDSYNGSELLRFYNKKLDAHYKYYLHGPLARLELGGELGKVQGIDYAYTLQGWLKGVNGTSIAPGTDIANDGKTGSFIPADAYAYSLGYYTGDYQPIGSNAPAFGKTYQTSNTDITGQSLYNGNISSSTVAISNISSGDPVGYTYHYDQLNRLKNMRQHSLTATPWDASTILADYKEDYTYDGNGNILTAQRNGSTTTGLDMDKLSYAYNRDANGNLTNNRLRHVTDAVTGASNYTADLKTQPTDNFKYDAIGNLINDTQAGIKTSPDGVTPGIEWSVYGKIQTIHKFNANGTALNNITYTYDAAGHRVSKTDGTTTTYYVRDAQGNTLALYDAPATAGSSITWREQYLHGSSRLGLWTPNINTAAAPNPKSDEWNTAGRKFYELTNHLGNVMATITDRRVQVASKKDSTILDHYTADVATAQDYYPGGMSMPGRTYTANSTTYRYGFNGKENDNEVKQDANGNNIIGSQQDYGMRISDPRLGRFLSVDPIAKKFPELTPYQFASNRPIVAIDLDGLEAVNTGTNTVDNTLSGSNLKTFQNNRSFTPWVDLISLHTSSTLLDYATRRGVRGLKDQPIEQASSNQLNLDHYSLHIPQLPKQFKTGDQFFSFLKGNFGQFVKSEGSSFSAANKVEDNLFNSKNPLSAIMRFDVTAPLYHDGLSVITSKVGSNYWVFSPVSSSTDWGHPVAGNRQFGLVQNSDNSYTFFIRGADRPWSGFDRITSELIFSGANELWSSAMNNLANYINSHGGKATVNPSISKRINWKHDVLGEKRRPAPEH